MPQEGRTAAHLADVDGISQAFDHIPGGLDGVGREFEGPGHITGGTDRQKTDLGRRLHRHET